jgi:hypothetical protein
MATHAERIEALQERRTARIESLRRESDARMKAAKATTDMIPFGQPTMPGHHSYKADINRRERARANMGKAIEADRTADRLESLGTPGVSVLADDATDQLTAKLAKLEAKQALMKGANAVLRKWAKKGEDGFADERAVPDLVALGMSESTARTLLVRTDWHRVQGFESYQLSNNNAVIANTRKRIAEVAKTQARTPLETQEGDGFTWGEDTDAELVFFKFDERVDDTTFKMMRQHGFVFSRTLNRFQRQATLNGVRTAERLAGVLDLR